MKKNRDLYSAASDWFKNKSYNQLEEVHKSGLFSQIRILL